MIMSLDRERQNLTAINWALLLFLFHHKVPDITVSVTGRGVLTLSLSGELPKYLHSATFTNKHREIFVILSL